MQKQERRYDVESPRKRKNVFNKQSRDEQEMDEHL